MDTLIITGGSSGIGLETGMQVIQQKMFKRVYVLDVQPPMTQQEGLIYIACDVADYLQVQAAVDKIAAENIVTHLFVCAGVLESNRLENSTVERLQQVININLMGCIFAIKAVLPYMQKNKQGNIVLTGSDQSFVGKSGNAVYGCTKAAVANLAKSIAVENAEYHIRVNSICPGTINTPFYQQATKQYAKRHLLQLEKVQADLASEQPLKRIGTASEVAELAVFLLSDKASFMTGATIPIDGGYTAQ